MAGPGDDVGADYFTSQLEFGHYYPSEAGWSKYDDAAHVGRRWVMIGSYVEGDLPLALPATRDLALGLGQHPDSDRQVLAPTWTVGVASTRETTPPCAAGLPPHVVLLDEAQSRG